MRFLIGAHLPPSLMQIFEEAGHDAVHTRELELGNRTPDSVINQISVDEQRVVVTKDADFVNSLIVSDIPYKLLLVSTGNIHNRALLSLFEDNLPQLVESLEIYRYVELERDRVIIHS